MKKYAKILITIINLNIVILKTKAAKLCRMRSNGDLWGAESELVSLPAPLEELEQAGPYDSSYLRFLVHERRTFVSHSWTRWVSFNQRSKKNTQKEVCFELNARRSLLKEKRWSGS